jgi:hypothetical protein
LAAAVGRLGILAVALLPVGCGQVPGKPAQAPAGPSPPAVPAPVVRRVVVSAPSGLGPAFTIGQSIQLAAVAEYSDGQSDTCTSGAAWTSTNDAVVKTTSRAGEVSMLAFGDAAVLATCSGVTGSLSLSVTRGIRIEGLEDDVPFALTSMDQQLRAFLVEGPGRAEECTEEGRWSTANPEIARFSPYDPGWLWLWDPGETIATVTCEGVTGSVLVKAGVYEINLHLVDADTGVPVPDAAVSASNQRTNASGRYHARGNQEIEQFSFWKLGYEPLVKVEVSWNRDLVMNRTYALAPVPGIFLRGSADLCGNAQRDCGPGKPPREQVHAFQAPHAGTLRVDAIWIPGGLYDDLLYELRCDGAVVGQGTARSASLRGRWFEVPASASCSYELRVRQSYHGTDSYEYAVSVR